jgi:hypothetical protein
VAPETTRRWHERRYRRTGTASFAVWFGWNPDGSSWTSVVPPPGARLYMSEAEIREDIEGT